MKLKELTEIKTNFPEADFWLLADGKTTKAYKPTHIGIKVTRTDVLVPDYLYYVLQYVEMQGRWRLDKPTCFSVGEIPLEKGETK